MVHRAAKLSGPGKQMLKEASERLSIVKPHPFAFAHALQLGDCARALRRGDGGDAKGGMEAEARPQDRGARLPLGRDGHPKPDHRGDLAPAAEQADEAGEADALEHGIVRVYESRVQPLFVASRALRQSTTAAQPRGAGGVGGGLAGDEVEKGVAEALREAAGVADPVAE